MALTRNGKRKRVFKVNTITNILNQCMRAQQKTEIIYQPVHISFIMMIIKEIPKRTLKSKRKALTKAPASS